MWLTVPVILVLGVVLATTLTRLRNTRFEMEKLRLQYREAQQRLLAQQATLATIEPLKALAEAAYNVLMLVNRERSVVYMNGAARELFGREEGRGIRLRSSLIAVTQSHEIDDLVRQCLNEPEEEIIEQIELRGCTYRVRVLRMAISEQPYIAIAMEDVSELQRLGRARREFVANISHELRTPITSIRLLVDTILRTKLENTEENRNTLHKIAAETEVLHQMAQELLDLSMIESGRAEFLLRPVAVNEVIDTAVALFKERAARKKLTIRCELCELNATDVTVLADREQLRRVISNLLHNAIKFTPRKGIIAISVSSDAEWATITVTDTGPGIPPQARERIFERFFRGDRARHTEGTGLGLAIAKHIVRAHGGEIWAEDPPNPPGARICFTVPLP
ncbi:MAG: sensor histidine kinase [Anaerolineae bacterium]